MPTIAAGVANKPAARASGAAIRSGSTALASGAGSGGGSQTHARTNGRGAGTPTAARLRPAGSFRSSRFTRSVVVSGRPPSPTGLGDREKRAIVRAKSERFRKAYKAAVMDAEVAYVEQLGDRLAKHQRAKYMAWWRGINRAAVQIQRIIRGFLARKHTQTKKFGPSAVRIQAMYRMVAAKSIAGVARRQAREIAAARAEQRILAARRRAAARQRHAAARKIQGMARGVAGRRLLLSLLPKATTDTSFITHESSVGSHHDADSFWAAGRRDGSRHRRLRSRPVSRLIGAAGNVAARPGAASGLFVSIARCGGLEGVGVAFRGWGSPACRIPGANGHDPRFAWHSRSRECGARAYGAYMAQRKARRVFSATGELRRRASFDDVWGMLRAPLMHGKPRAIVGLVLPDRDLRAFHKWVPPGDLEGHYRPNWRIMQRRRARSRIAQSTRLSSHASKQAEVQAGQFYAGLVRHTDPFGLYPSVVKATTRAGLGGLLQSHKVSMLAAASAAAERKRDAADNGLSISVPRGSPKSFSSFTPWDTSAAATPSSHEIAAEASGARVGPAYDMLSPLASEALAAAGVQGGNDRAASAISGQGVELTPGMVGVVKLHKFTPVMATPSGPTRSPAGSRGSAQRSEDGGGAASVAGSASDAAPRPVLVAADPDSSKLSEILGDLGIQVDPHSGALKKVASKAFVRPEELQKLLQADPGGSPTFRGRRGSDVAKMVNVVIATGAQAPKAAARRPAAGATTFSTAMAVSMVSPKAARSPSLRRLRMTKSVTRPMAERLAAFQLGKKMGSRLRVWPRNAVRRNNKSAAQSPVRAKSDGKAASKPERDKAPNEPKEARKPVAEPAKREAPLAKLKSAIRHVGLRAAKPGLARAALLLVDERKKMDSPEARRRAAEARAAAIRDTKRAAMASIVARVKLAKRAEDARSDSKRISAANVFQSTVNGIVAEKRFVKEVKRAQKASVRNLRADALVSRELDRLHERDAIEEAEHLAKQALAELTTDAKGRALQFLEMSSYPLDHERARLIADHVLARHASFHADLIARPGLHDVPGAPPSKASRRKSASAADVLSTVRGTPELVKSASPISLPEKRSATARKRRRRFQHKQSGVDNPFRESPWENHRLWLTPDHELHRLAEEMGVTIPGAKSPKSGTTTPSPSVESVTDGTFVLGPDEHGAHFTAVDAVARASGVDPRAPRRLEQLDRLADQGLMLLPLSTLLREMRRLGCHPDREWEWKVDLVGEILTFLEQRRTVAVARLRSHPMWQCSVAQLRAKASRLGLDVSTNDLPEEMIVLYSDDDFRVELVEAIVAEGEERLQRNVNAARRSRLWALDSEVIRERLRECKAPIPPTHGLGEVEEKLVLVKSLELELMLIGKDPHQDVVEQLADPSTTLKTTLRRMSSYHPSEYRVMHDMKAHRLEDREDVVRYLNGLGAYVHWVDDRQRSAVPRSPTSTRLPNVSPMQPMQAVATAKSAAAEATATGGAGDATAPMSA